MTWIVDEMDKDYLKCLGKSVKELKESIVDIEPFIESASGEEKEYYEERKEKMEAALRRKIVEIMGGKWLGKTEEIRLEGRAGVWIEILEPGMTQPGRWFIAKEYETGKQARAAKWNLSQRNVKIPPGIWEFATRQNCVMARYLREK